MNRHPRAAWQVAQVFLWLVLVLYPDKTLHAGSKTCDRHYATTFASITYCSEDDLVGFARSIGSGPGFFQASPRKDPRLTARRVDAVVMQVMTILDMAMPGLRFSLQLLPDDSEIQKAYAMFATGTDTPIAYYDHTRRTIFLSVDNVDDRILAHEIAHAVICAWSPSPIPVQSQEVLANFVEEHLE